MLQKLLIAIFPRKWKASIEQESRQWIGCCSCGFETSIWELGGIRWKAKGTPIVLVNCPGCGEKRLFKFTKTQ